MLITNGIDVFHDFCMAGLDKPDAQTFTYPNPDDWRTCRRPAIVTGNIMLGGVSCFIVDDAYIVEEADWWSDSALGGEAGVTAYALMRYPSDREDVVDEWQREHNVQSDGNVYCWDVATGDCGMIDDPRYAVPVGEWEHLPIDVLRRMADLSYYACTPVGKAICLLFTGGRYEYVLDGVCFEKMPKSDEDCDNGS